MQIWATNADDDMPWLGAVTQILRDGGAVALPTDTYYGLAADSRSVEGIARVLQLKGRATSHPILLLAADTESARAVAAVTDSRFDLLAAEFWPGPLTLVVPARAGLPAPLLGPSGGVAVRVPAASVPRAVAASLGAAITGTSANLTGEPAVAAVSDLNIDSERLDGVVDGGLLPGGQPSTIVDLTTTPARLLREGAVAAETIRKSLSGRLI